MTGEEIADMVTVGFMLLAIVFNVLAIRDMTEPGDRPWERFPWTKASRERRRKRLAADDEGQKP